MGPLSPWWSVRGAYGGRDVKNLPKALKSHLEVQDHLNNIKAPTLSYFSILRKMGNCASGFSVSGVASGMRALRAWGFVAGRGARAGLPET